MSEEVIIDREILEMAKAEMAKDPRLRPCHMCLHYEAESRKCKMTGRQREKYHYGAACFLTNEAYLEALLKTEKKRSMAEFQKMNTKMDVMGAMIVGASLIQEDLLEKLEQNYARLDIKAKNDDEVYKKSKKNLERLRKCYANMKAAMHTIESNYEQYIGYWQAQMFADEQGVYSAEWDKYISNGGLMTYFMFAFYDKMYQSKDNVNKAIEFLNSLPGRDLLEEKDVKRYLIKI